MTRRVRSERPPRLDGAGFTLIELLVVIAIVARTVDDLLALHREAPSSVRAYLDGPGVGDGVLLLIDRNGDDLIDLLELYEYPGAYARKVDGIDKAAGEPLQRFLELVAWELKLGLLTKAGAPEPARAQEPRAHEPELFTPEAVCLLTRAHVSDAPLADRRCAMVRAGRETPGIEPRHEKFLEMLDDEINRTITRKNAATIETFLILSAGGDAGPRR